MADLMLSWPAAVALIAAVVAISVGVLRMYMVGRSTVSLSSVQEDVYRLQTRVHELERQVSSMETSLDSTVATQISDIKSDLRRMADKVDVLVKEVVLALGAMSR